MTERHGRITNVILCEDIRHELNNRNTLVGVYGGDILVQEFPTSLRIAVYAEYLIDAPAAHRVAFRVTYRGGAKHAAVEAGMNVPASAESGVAFAIPPKEFLLEERGVVTLEVRFGDEDWVELASKRVNQSRSLGGGGPLQN